MCIGIDCKICSYLRVALLFFFATRDTYRFFWSVIIFLWTSACFCIAFPLSMAFLIARWHVLTLLSPWPQWRYFNLLSAVQLLIHDRRNTQMMSCKHFAFNYCNTTLNFRKISSITSGTTLAKQLTAWNFEWMKSLCALTFIRITGLSLLLSLHLILLLFVISRERYFA